MPQQKITLSQRIFYLGLLIMLVTGIISTTIIAANNPLVPALIITGAILALAARIWSRRIHKATRKNDNLVDLGGYPIDLLTDPRFTSH